MILRILKALFGSKASSAAPRPAPGPRHNQPPPLPGSAPTRGTPTRPPPKRLTALDSDLFTAISTAEATKQAKTARGTFGWNNLWAFGRTSVIPPATDPRTLIIDRAMVGEGLITPEELTEIHEIGLQMDELRPTLDTAHQRGQAAVTLDKEARTALKKQKKEEAEQKKRQRAADIAHRHQTDIIFLGRGVSSGLADRRAHIEKLQAARLPVLATPAELAKAMGLTIRRLRWLAFHAEVAAVTHYIRFQVPKKSGGVRELAAPHRDLADAQRWIYQHILLPIPLPGVAHGFVPGRSTVTNARAHTRKDLVLNADLKDFFPSITFPRVRGIFQELGYSPAVATILALICTESPRRTVAYSGQTFHVATGPRALPQGACTSPALSNLCARKLDHRFAALAATHGWTYTRYADDLTFSARGSDAAQKLALIQSRMHSIVKDENFTVNEAKTRIQRRNTQQSVTGIVVNDQANVSRKVRRRLRAILHQAEKTGLNAQNRRQHPNFPAWVQGMIAYISMIQPSQGERLKEALCRLKK
jgi:RNA-directed DNA polymerase